MGQATVDLPDPSEMPAAPMNSADDLLSQMAGDEIDRLLAEAEVEKTAAPAPAPSTTGVQPLAGPSVSESQLDELLNNVDDAAKSAPPRPPLVNVPDEAAIKAALFDDPKPKPAIPKSRSLMPGAVIQPEESEPVEQPIVDAKAEAKQLDEALAKGSTDALPEVKVLEAETSSAEKNALADAINSLDAPAEHAAVVEEAPIPFYLKPLVWLNFPMEFLPPPARAAIGKVALMTLVNSIAVLAYVLLFRKHH